MLKSQGIHPLWSPLNKTQYSSVFAVFPGQCCVLHAAHLEEWKVRQEAQEILVPQTICVRRLIHEYKDIPREDCPCNWIFDIKAVYAELVDDHPVITCNGPWQLTRCRNLGIIGVPGTYRLELNDVTAIGEAQVYAEIFDLSSFAAQVKDLFFA